jgi:hypothetical protein
MIYPTGLRVVLPASFSCCFVASETRESIDSHSLGLSPLASLTQTQHSAPSNSPGAAPAPGSRRMWQHRPHRSACARSRCFSDLRSVGSKALGARARRRPQNVAPHLDLKRRRSAPHQAAVLLTVHVTVSTQTVHVTVSTHCTPPPPPLLSRTERRPARPAERRCAAALRRLALTRLYRARAHACTSYDRSAARRAANSSSSASASAARVGAVATGAAHASDSTLTHAAEGKGQRARGGRAGERAEGTCGERGAHAEPELVQHLLRDPVCLLGRGGVGGGRLQRPRAQERARPSQSAGSLRGEDPMQIETRRGGEQAEGDVPRRGAAGGGGRAHASSTSSSSKRPSSASSTISCGRRARSRQRSKVKGQRSQTGRRDAGAARGRGRDRRDAGDRCRRLRDASDAPARACEEAQAADGGKGSKDHTCFMSICAACFWYSCRAAPPPSR